ncbi:DUF1501 domain-containing protein [Tundrisphaera lichenicola]|uniref:DUF1501 domain-containing protein n=1 Tax=Tundrisphaera lichenicola TaxID=2029860 RepID=UPI003EB81FCB
MKCTYSCQSSEHLIARRGFLAGLAASATGSMIGGLGVFSSPAAAAQLGRDQKRVVVFNMHGGLSQLESWDPKPGTETGGPFRSIETSVPGIRISELLPNVARQMQHLCLLRGVNTSEDDHGKGAYMMLTGRRQTPAADYPYLGAVCAKAMTPEGGALPGHIIITPGGAGGRGNDAAYLGPKYSSIALGNGKPPQNTTRPDQVTESMDAARNDVRKRLNDRFLNRRRTAITEAYAYSYDQAYQLMRQREVFDVEKEPAKDHERYGKYDFGRHCLLARRLVEKGVTFVQVSHSNYDTHNENFNFHIEQLGEFDRSFAAFVADLADRGLLESTLIVVLSEFGRTPNVNLYYGRDHWSRAWSVVMAGSGIRRGMAFGSTNDKGTEVVDGQVDHANLFHTYLQAVGVDSTDSFDLDGRDVLLADPASKMIPQVLS